MLTPGGHRRFTVEAIDAFTQSRQQLQPRVAPEKTWSEKALTRTRTEITQGQPPQSLQEMDSAVRDTHRRLGRQLMGLTMQFLSAEYDSDDLLAEARNIGQEYGRIGIQTNMSLTDITEAMMYFRDTLLEVALELPENTRVKPDSNVRFVRRINQLLNTVQLAMAGEYETHG